MYSLQRHKHRTWLGVGLREPGVRWWSGDNTADRLERRSHPSHKRELLRSAAGDQRTVRSLGRRRTGCGVAYPRAEVREEEMPPTPSCPYVLNSTFAAAATKKPQTQGSGKCSADSPQGAL